MDSGTRSSQIIGSDPESGFREDYDRFTVCLSRIVRDGRLGRYTLDRVGEIVPAIKKKSKSVWQRLTDLDHPVERIDHDGRAGVQSGYHDKNANSKNKWL